MPFRVLDQAPQYLSSDGTKVLSGGSLTFYESGTSTLKDTYTDPTLNAANDNPLILDADGRSSDIWGDGNYRMVVADALGVIQWTRDFTQGPADLPAQAGNGGKLLSTDGSALSWVAVLAVPDVAGQQSKFLSNDGTDPYWAPSPLPALVAGGFLTNDGSTVSWEVPSSSGGANKAIIGTNLFQWGSATIPPPASGSHSASMNLTFPVAFSSLKTMFVTISTANVTAVGGNAIVAVQGRSNTGATIEVDIGDYSNNSGGINTSINFDWLAIGAS